MPDELTAGEKLDRSLNEKPGNAELRRIEEKLDTKMDAILQAVQNLAGRVDELSRQFAARK